MERKILIGAAIVVAVMLSVRFIHPPGSTTVPSVPVPDDPWFQTHVVEKPFPVLVDFSATWCPPCRQLAVHLKRLEQEFAGRIEVVTLDVDEHPDLARHYGAERIPMILIMDHGEILAGEVGLLSYEKLKYLVQRQLATVPTPTTDNQQTPR